MICGYCVLWFQLPEGNSSISGLHDMHCRPLVLWCSISVVYQERYVKGKLLGILFHYVPETAVLHRDHLMHLYKLCYIYLVLGSVILVLKWLLPWMLKKVLWWVGVYSNIACWWVKSIKHLLQSFWWVSHSIPWVQEMHILVWVSLVEACFW